MSALDDLFFIVNLVFAAIGVSRSFVFSVPAVTVCWKSSSAPVSDPGVGSGSGPGSGSGSGEGSSPSSSISDV